MHAAVYDEARRNMPPTAFAELTDPNPDNVRTLVYRNPRFPVNGGKEALLAASTSPFVHVQGWWTLLMRGRSVGVKALPFASKHRRVEALSTDCHDWYVLESESHRNGGRSPPSNPPRANR